MECGVGRRQTVGDDAHIVPTKYITQEPGGENRNAPTDGGNAEICFFCICANRRQTVGDDAHIVPTKYGIVVEKSLNRHRALTNMLLCRIIFI